MHSRRYQRAHGEDMTGMTTMQRNAQERSFRDTPRAAPKRGAAPTEDSRVTGSKVANLTPKTGSGAGFDVYVEKPGGRAKGRGKRV